MTGRPMPTTVAPSASALNTWSARRTPESKTIGMRPSTAWAMRGSTVMVACTPSKARPPWFETQTASRPTFTAIAAAFADCTPLGMTARPPASCLIHSRSFQSRSRLRARDHFLSRGEVHAARRVAEAERRRRHEPAADVLLARIGPDIVDRRRDRGVAGGLGALEQLAGVAAVGRHIELEPFRAGIVRRDLLQAQVRHRRGRHQRADRGGALRGRRLLLDVGAAMAAHRRNEDRQRQLRAQDFGREIDLG